jgi:hypothetical protein
LASDGTEVSAGVTTSASVAIVVAGRIGRVKFLGRRLGWSGDVFVNEDSRRGRSSPGREMGRGFDRLAE